jgi:hypothetical protein
MEAKRIGGLALCQLATHAEKLCRFATLLFSITGTAIFFVAEYTLVCIFQDLAESRGNEVFFPHTPCLF